MDDIFPLHQGIGTYDMYISTRIEHYTRITDRNETSFLTSRKQRHDTWMGKYVVSGSKNCEAQRAQHRKGTPPGEGGGCSLDNLL